MIPGLNAGLRCGRIGGECAGAVTLMPAGEPFPERQDRYRELSNEELVDVVRTLPRRPLLAGVADVRLSLAGAQAKVAVKVSGDKISIPLDGALSTHILKPGSEHFSGLVVNEMLCLSLAREAGLPTAKAEIRSIDRIDFLLIERYDRALALSGDSEHYVRLHQEDFCQALGIVSDHKYQAEGGPSLKQCFDLLREVSSAPVIDLQRLLDAVIYNYLIANTDAHGKNFSLLYNQAGTRLAPLYDVVSTLYYPDLSRDMAMRIGGEYSSEKVTPSNFERMAEEARLAKPIVRRRVPELADMVHAALTKVPAAGQVSEAVAALIRRRCETVKNSFLQS